MARGHSIKVEFLEVTRTQSLQRELAGKGDEGEKERRRKVGEEIDG